MNEGSAQPINPNIPLKNSVISTKAKILIGVIVVALLLLLFLVILPQSGVYKLSGFGEPGTFRTWSLLDTFNVFDDSSKQKKKVKINTLNSIKGVNVVTKDDVTTITTLRNNKSITIPTKIGLGLSKEGENLYTSTNAMLVQLLKMADSLKSNVIVNTTHDVESFNEKVQLLLEYESKLDSMVATQLSGVKLTSVQNTLTSVKNDRHSILEISEGFSNDLPNQNVKFTEDMNYNDYMADVALEPSIKKQHTDYINDKTKLSNTPSFLPTPSHSTNVVPFVGLRRPEYAVKGVDLVEDSARSIPSTVDFNQLDKPIKISWQ